MVSARRTGKIFKVEVKINQEDSAEVMTNLVFSMVSMVFVTRVAARAEDGVCAVIGKLIYDLSNRVVSGGRGEKPVPHRGLYFFYMLS